MGITCIKMLHINFREPQLGGSLQRASRPMKSKGVGRTTHKKLTS